MAIPFTTLNTVCRDVIVPKVADNIFKSNILTYRLLKNAKKYKGGENVEVPINYAKNTNAEFYGDAATLTITKREILTKAKYAPVRANNAITLEGIAMEMNYGEGKVLDMVKEQMKVAEASLKDIFGDNLFNTTQANSFIGLQTICAVDGGTGTALGGINGGPNGDMASWYSSSGTGGKEGGPDSTTTSLTKLALDKHFNSACYDNDRPTIGITTYDIWSGIMTTFLMPNMRYTDTKLAELGFDNFKYRGVDFFPCDKVDVGDLYFLNEKHLWMEVFPNMNFKFIDFDTAINSDVYTAHIRWYGVLVCDSRRTQAWMSAITGVAA